MNKYLKALAEAGNFRADEKTDIVLGNCMGYPFIVSYTGNKYDLIFSVSNGNFPNLADLKGLSKDAPALKGCSVSGYRVTYTIKPGMSKEAFVSNALEAIRTATDFFSRNSYFPCCEKSGESGSTEAYIVSGVPQLLSEKSFSEMSMNLTEQAYEVAKKDENLVAGIVGAILGSLIGVVAIVIIGQLGYVSVISGVIMGVCTVKGYSLLAGKLSAKGIIISCAIILIMVYVGDRLGWAFLISKELGYGIFESFSYVHDVIKASEMTGTYIGELIKLYIFTLLGAIPTIIGTAREVKNKHVSYKI